MPPARKGLDMSEDIKVLEALDDLECSEYESLDEIKRKYKQKAIKCHPDRNPGSEDAFKKLSSAFDTVERFLNAGNNLQDAKNHITSPEPSQSPPNWPPPGVKKARRPRKSKHPVFKDQSQDMPLPPGPSHGGHRPFYWEKEYKKAVDRYKFDHARPINAPGGFMNSASGLYIEPVIDLETAKRIFDRVVRELGGMMALPNNVQNPDPTLPALPYRPVVMPSSPPIRQLPKLPNFNDMYRPF